MHSSWSCFASTHPSWWRHMPPMILVGIATAEFWGPTRWKPIIRSARWFWGSTTKSSWVAHHVCIPQILDMCIASPWPCRRHDLFCHVLASVHVPSVSHYGCPNARPSPLPVHQHKPAWPSPSSSVTVPMLHTCTPQVERHSCTNT
jgi:hypothetical protein